MSDTDTKLGKLFVSLKGALQWWFTSVFPKKEVPSSLDKLLEIFSAPIDPMLEYHVTKLREGGEAIMLMVLAHGIDELVIRRIAEAYPKDSDGKEVDPSPFVKPSRRFARKINEYLIERKKRLAMESASTAKASEEIAETSTAAAGIQSVEQ